MEYIAEIGWNFMGDISLAHEMVKAAKHAGASTVKFQYWDPKKLKPGAWDYDGRRKIYEEARLNENKINDLKLICSQYNIKFLTSVFNHEDATYIKKFGDTAIKIPSHEVANVKLIRYALNEFEQVYISAGACTVAELDQLAELTNELRAKDRSVYVMHCVSSYPCDVDRINLNRIDALRERFSNSLGLSDHTTSILVPALAVAKGARVIEKHFTTNQDLPGRDNKFAVLPEQFSQLVKNCDEAKAAFTDRGINAQLIENDTIENYRGRWG